MSKELRIFKYNIPITDSHSIGIPTDADLLSVQKQGAMFCLWAIVNTDNPVELVHIEVIGTGNAMDDRKRRYISTVQDGNLVWHFFQNFPD